MFLLWTGAVQSPRPHGVYREEGTTLLTAKRFEPILPYLTDKKAYPSGKRSSIIILYGAFTIVLLEAKNVHRP